MTAVDLPTPVVRRPAVSPVDAAALVPGPPRHRPRRRQPRRGAAVAGHLHEPVSRRRAGGGGGAGGRRLPGGKQAVRVAAAAADLDLRWFEEPVSSDDLHGLRLVRDRVSPDVAAGEYGIDLPYFRRMCAAGAVDCLQVDATRCGGPTEWLRAAAVAAAFGLEVSGHCARHLHAHVLAARATCCAAASGRKPAASLFTGLGRRAAGHADHVDDAIGSSPPIGIKTGGRGDCGLDEWLVGISLSRQIVVTIRS